MITGLDHVVILVQDLNAATGAYERLLARAPSWHSEGDGFGAALFTLDNVTVELMAPNGTGAAADRVRAALDQQGEGMASLCFKTDDIARLHRRLDRLALGPEPVTHMTGRDATTGQELAWSRTRAATDRTRGVRLFFLQLDGARPKSKATAEAPVTGMDHVVISTSDPERAAALYGARLGLDMALDRSHPDWGRLMFFRCGEMIVELVHRNEMVQDSERDRLFGLSWRVDDLDAAHRRLAESGVEVSDIRIGRKPGTRVASIKDGVCGVPTLLLERQPKS